MKNELIDNSLLSFNIYKDFVQFYKALGVHKVWRVSTGTMNSRGEYIRDRRYYLVLKNLFESKNMYHKKASIAEIVSWLDSFLIIDRLFTQLDEYSKHDFLNNCSIYSEYVIKMSKKMRIDYVLLYGKVVILLEFRIVSNFDKIKSTWKKKKLELLIYKEMLQNYVPSDYKILTFALITLPEYDLRSKIDKHIEYNANQIKFLSKYIIDFSTSIKI